MRFTAPPDVSGITLSSGPLTVLNGHVEVPENASAGDLGSLASYGFTPAPETPHPRASSAKAQSAPQGAPNEAARDTSTQ